MRLGGDVGMNFTSGGGGGGGGTRTMMLAEYVIGAYNYTSQACL